MSFTYFYRSMRGPGIGHQPEGFDPDTRKAGSIESQTPFGLRTFWGIVSYPSALTPDQVYRFELWPCRPIEFAKWRAWEQIRKDGSLWILKDYASYVQDEEKLAKLSAHSRAQFDKNENTIVAQILLDAEIDLDELEGKLDGS